MSDTLGNGQGNPTDEQIKLYETWARGGVAAAMIGEVQGDPRTLEHPGALAPGWIGTPRGPSALDLDRLHCAALDLSEILALPERFARTARLAHTCGFARVQIHAAHGFLFSQFLSPLFNQRTDTYGGTRANRMRLVIEVVDAVRAAVPKDFTVAIKLNATDQIEGGLTPDDALEVVAALDNRGLDLMEVSGGTYFPGAAPASDTLSGQPYFFDFCQDARKATNVPLMATGGFKTRGQSDAALASGAIDCIGLARALVLDPSLPTTWQARGPDSVYPRFAETVPGGVTAWYTQGIQSIATGSKQGAEMSVLQALEGLGRRSLDQKAAMLCRAINLA